MSRRLDALLLFGLPRRALDVCLTVVVAAAVAVSRFAVLASGPWEWDETLFARGILDFNLAAHFPHPPGFPGWLAIGHLLQPLAGEPLVALQWASAGLSVLALWPLVSLGRRVAPATVAVAAAVMLLAAPGPWLFAVRGFSSTAAAVLALSAAAIAAGGLEGRRLTLFTVLVSTAFLVRPVLLPPLAVLWTGVALSVRPLRRLLPGVAVGAGLGLVSLLLMVHAEGGWRAFVEAFTRHGARHFSRLADNPGGFAELGLTKGLGGSVWAVLVLVLAVAGLVVWARRLGRASAVLWLLVLSVAVAQMLWMQNRSYARYAVPVQMALAPLVAAGAGLAPPAVACAGLVVAAGLLGARSLPPVLEQHRSHLAAWQAVRWAEEEAGRRGWSVVVEPEMHPFASYHWHLATREGGVAPPPLVLSPWAPEPWQGVSGRYLLATVHPQLYLPEPAVRQRSWAGVSAALQPLTQQRFLEAVVIDNPPLPVGRWWARELTPSGEAYMWAGVDAELLLPPLQLFSQVVLDLQPAAGDAELEVLANGHPVSTLGGRSERRRLRIPARVLRSDGSNSIRLRRSTARVPGGGDERPLSVQVFGVAVLEPGRPWAGSPATAREREMLGIEIAGAYPAEEFGARGRGVWLAPSATLDLSCAEGEIVMTLWAPRPSSPEVVLRVAGRRVAGPLALGREAREVVLPIRSEDLVEGRVELGIDSAPFVPAEMGDSADTRRLGVVVTHLAYRPATPVGGP